MKLMHDGNCWRYKGWYIYQEALEGMFTHCFFHDTFDGSSDSPTKHLQGAAQSLEDAVKKIEELVETKSD